MIKLLEKCKIRRPNVNFTRYAEANGRIKLGKSNGGI